MTESKVTLDSVMTGIKSCGSHVEHLGTPDHIFAGGFFAGAVSYTPVDPTKFPITSAIVAGTVGTVTGMVSHLASFILPKFAKPLFTLTLYGSALVSLSHKLEKRRKRLREKQKLDASSSGLMPMDSVESPQRRNKY